LAIASSAWAASKTVCAKGCSFTSIQTAINAASPGATITIGAGTYVENVVVDKPLTLQGAGRHTTIEPATSNPVCEGGSLCAGTASNIVLVEASNVTLTKLSLEGDNPGLTSGVVRGGKDIDARNGIITNHELGTYNGLTVTKVKVADVYLRGMYASTGGTFDFEGDTVENVQGEGASIAMFAFGGSGVMSHNKVSSANDAISANHSTGTQFLDNKITKSGSGVHTDNNGDSGGSADVIEGNKISECSSNGYGIFVFVPYVSPTVKANKVKGCYIGIAAFGGAVAGMIVRPLLSEQHQSQDSRDVVKMTTGLIGTLTALVLGLLIASAKSSFDQKTNQVRQLTATIILIDDLFMQYGPEAVHLRSLLRQSIPPLANRIWQEEGVATGRPVRFVSSAEALALENELERLPPANDTQRSLQSRAIQAFTEAAQIRLQLFARTGGSIPTPFLIILVFWLSAIFVSATLFAETNLIVITALFVGALSFASAVFLVLELDNPFTGLMGISSATLWSALPPLAGS